jgi:hypothetical protein
MRPGFGLACVLVAGSTAAGVLAFGLERSPDRTTEATAAAAVVDPACPYRIPRGRTIAAAQATTRLFVTEVVLRRNPVCGFSLSSAKLRRQIARDRWLREDTPVRPFPTRFPPVALPDASRDPEAPQAVYTISRRVLEFVVTGADGNPEIPMAVGVAAPDAGMGAYRVVLVIDEGNWRVDRWWRVRITSIDS